MHLSIRYVVLVCHQYDVFEHFVGSVYIGGYGGKIVMSYVNCGGDG